MNFSYFKTDDLVVDRSIYVGPEYPTFDHIPHLVVAACDDPKENSTTMREMLVWCVEAFGNPDFNRNQWVRWYAESKPHYVTFFRFRYLTDAALFQMRWR